MASTIKIKRSETAGNPSVLGAGELAYSALPSNGANGGDRLYIGIGTEIEGNAVNHVVIGGKYFTDLLDHTPGVVVPSSAVITDAYGKINLLTIGDLLVSNNEITSTGSNQDLSLTGSGTGKVKVSGAYTLPKVVGTAGYVLTTDGSGTSSWEQAASTLLISTDNGGDTLDLLVDSLNVEGTSGVTTSFNQNSNTLTISNVDTAPGVKGVAQFVTEEFEITSGVVGLKHSAVKGIAASLVSAGSSQTGITVSYNANTTKLDFAVPTTTLEITGAVTGTSSVLSAHNITLSTSIPEGSITNEKLDNHYIGIGSTQVALGETMPALSGITHANIANLRLLDNTLSVTEANANLNLRANGTGVISAGNFLVSDVATPVNPNDAANKSYVDSAVQGIKWKAPVNLVVASNIALAGSTGTLSIDGHAVLSNSHDGYRLLLKGQTSALENGIYDYNDNGSSYTLTRSADANQVSELIGASVFVEEGTNYRATGWIQANHYAVAYSDQTWVQFSAAATYTQGNGIVIDGTQIAISLASNSGLAFDGSSLKLSSALAGSGLTYTSGVLNLIGTADRIVANADSVDIAATYAGQTSITTLGTIGTGVWEATAVGATYGGTGLTTISVGDLLLGGAGNTYSKLTIGAQGKLLQSNGTTLVYSDLDGGTY